MHIMCFVYRVVVPVQIQIVALWRQYRWVCKEWAIQMGVQRVGNTDRCGKSGQYRWVCKEWTIQMGVERVSNTDGCGKSEQCRWVCKEWAIQMGVERVSTDGCAKSGQYRCKEWDAKMQMGVQRVGNTDGCAKSGQYRWVWKEWAIQMGVERVSNADGCAKSELDGTRHCIYGEANLLSVQWQCSRSTFILMYLALLDLALHSLILFAPISIRFYPFMQCAKSMAHTINLSFILGSQFNKTCNYMFSLLI